MKTKAIAAGLILMTSALMFTGCYKPWHRVEGNYDVDTEYRDFPPFERVFNEGNFDVYIIQDGLSEVEIEAESNLIPFIRTRIEGSALVIDTKDNLQNNFPMKIFVHTDEIKEIRLSGSGLIEADSILTGDLEIDLSGSGVIYLNTLSEDVDCDISGSGSIDLHTDCDHLEAFISGSGDMDLYGRANYGGMRISGSGQIRAYELILQDCQAKISGSGNMYLNVEDNLSVNISGSGNIYYMGSPSLDISITGSGSVIHP